MSDEPTPRARVECRCGLVIVSDDPEIAMTIMDAHDCPKARPAEDADRWYHHVFSFYGVVAIIIICTALAQIFGHGK